MSSRPRHVVAERIGARVEHVEHPDATIFQKTVRDAITLVGVEVDMRDMLVVVDQFPPRE